MFKGRPHANIVQSYGAEFADGARSVAAGRMARAAEQRRLARDAARSRSRPRKPAVFEELRGVVLQDWTDAMMAEQRSAAVRALAKKYTVKVEAARE